MSMFYHDIMYFSKFSGCDAMAQIGYNREIDWNKDQ